MTKLKKVFPGLSDASKLMFEEFKRSKFSRTSKINSKAFRASSAVKNSDHRIQHQFTLLACKILAANFTRLA